MLDYLADQSSEKLFDEADRLLNAHSKRAPHHDKINGLIARIERTQDPALRFRRAICLTRLEFALFDVDATVRRLSEGIELDTPSQKAQRSALALEIARALAGGNTARRSFRVIDRAFIFRGLAEVAGRNNAHDRQVIGICRLLFDRKYLLALQELCRLAPQDPSLFDDVVSTVKLMYRRPYNETVIKQIDDVIAPILKLKEARKAAGQLFTLKVDVQSRAARAGDGAAPELDDVRRFLASHGQGGIGILMQAKDLFISVFPHDEEMKLSIIEPFMAAVAARPSSMAAKKLLESAAQTRRFWDDPAFRDQIGDVVMRAIKRDDSGPACFIRGMESFLADDPIYIEHFAKAAQLSPLISTTGASSVFGGLSDDDEAPLRAIEVDMSGIEKTDAAYVCCADLKYFIRYAAKYAASARQLGAEVRLHFHVAAPTRMEAAQAFERELADVANVSFSWEKPAFAVPSYYASMRFLRAPDFITHVASRIVLTDIDVLFKKAPKDFLDRMQATGAEGGFRTYDRVRKVHKLILPRGTIYRYPRLLPWSIVNAACLYLTDLHDQRVARQVAKDMRRHLGRALERNQNAWWIDQNSLYVSLRALMPLPDMRLANIEDHNLPFGTFDYSATTIASLQHPHFSGSLTG